VLAVRRRNRVPLIATAITVIAGLLLFGSTAFAADPPGDNGTIKLDTEPFDDTPGNEPHVGCPFQIDFFGFDEGDLTATITLLAWDPTQPDREHRVAPDVTLFIGQDPAGGGTDLDASQTYDETNLDFSGIEPQPNQGFHVKAIVHAEGAQGADVKYKVFWVQPCEATTTSSSSTTSSSTTSSSTTSSTTTTTTTPPGGGGGGAQTTTTSTILGAPPQGEAGEVGGLARTGSNSLPLLVAALALLGLGTASLLVTMRKRQRGGAR
jgi:hypothetical protein